MKLLNIIFLVLFAFGAQASVYSDINYRALISKIQSKIKARKRKGLESRLLKFTVSPNEPRVKDEISLFIQPLTSFTDSNMLLEATLDGASVTAKLEHPAKELWVLDAGPFTEVGVHNLTAKIFLQDAASSQAIVDAIAVLDAAIERYRREKFLAAANAGYAALKRNPKLWKEELDERASWDSTLADGTK